MSEYVYEKILSELSDKDKKIIMTMAKTGLSKTGELMKEAGLKPNEYSLYRDRLKKKGLIDVQEYGKMTLLPL